MIELPRAALRAADIAQTAEFFSFGTNDLTQTTLGISRDDAALFMEDYLKAGIFERAPFVTIDHAGVGDLITRATQRRRSVRTDIKLSICCEHGVDPPSDRFRHNAGLDHVSPEHSSVPIARLAGTTAAITH